MSNAYHFPFQQLFLDLKMSLMLKATFHPLKLPGFLLVQKIYCLKEVLYQFNIKKLGQFNFERDIANSANSLHN